MSSFVDWIIEFQLTYGHMIKPLIVGTLVSIVCSVVGCFIILRRMSFLADAISHSMIAGVIGGYLLMKILFQTEAKLGTLLIGALIAGIVTVAHCRICNSRVTVEGRYGNRDHVYRHFCVGALVVSIKSFGELVHIDIYHYILGSVVSVSDDDLWLLAGVTAIVLSVVILFYRQLQLTSFDPIMAASIGIPVLAMEYLLTACTSLVVVSGVQIAGVILVIGLIITPAASAYLLTDRLSRMIVVSAIIGVLGFWLGFRIATWLGADPGPAVIVTMTLIFLFTLIFAPSTGCLPTGFAEPARTPGSDGRRARCHSPRTGSTHSNFPDSKTCHDTQQPGTSSDSKAGSAGIVVGG